MSKDEEKCGYTVVHGGKFEWKCVYPPHDDDKHYLKPVNFTP